MDRLTRMDVLRKCVTVFEAIRRMASKGNAGLEAERGTEEEYSTVDECIRIMKEWMREMQSAEIRPVVDPHRYVEIGDEKVTRIADWQREVMENGPDEELRLR